MDNFGTVEFGDHIYKQSNHTLVNYWFGQERFPIKLRKETIELD